MEIRGRVVSGTGEGQHYVKEYTQYFENALGFTCFPGTLNIKVDQIPNLNGFKKFRVIPEKSEFAPVDCYLVVINDEVDGAIVIPEKTRHGPDIIELIASVNLREHFELKDGDEVVCELV